MAGIAGILQPYPSPEPMLWRARRLLDDDAAWQEISALAAVGHGTPSRCGRQGRVLLDTGTGIALAMDGEVFEVGGSRVESRTASQRLVLEEYLAHGPDFASRLNGSFSIAIVDCREPQARLILTCDSGGSLPVYHAEGNGAFVFSSKLGLLARSGLVAVEPDLEAAADLFAFSFYLGESTPFRNVRCLPPGSTLVRTGGVTRVRTRQTFPREARPFSSRSRCLSEILERFSDVVKHHIDAERRTAIGLTGGLDSRAVAAAAVKAKLRPASLVHTVTGATDSELARRVAEACGFDHAWVRVEPEGLAEKVEPFLEITGGLVGTLEPHTLCCLSSLCDTAEVFVTGIGGEFARGFYYAKEPSLPDGNAALASLLFRKMNCVITDDGLARRLFELPELHDVRQRAGERLERVLEALPDGLSPASRLDLFYLQERLRKLLIVKGTTVVRSAVEIRHPFLDEPLLQLIWRMPAGLRRTSDLHRHLIASNHPPLSRIPVTKTGKAIPSGYLRRLQAAVLHKSASAVRRIRGLKGSGWRPSVNYDYPGWTRGDLGSYLGGILLDERTCDRGIFRPDGVRSVLDEHFSGERDHTGAVLALTAFELGLRLADAGRESMVSESADLDRRIT